MADLQKTIEIIFQGDDKVSGVVGGIGESIGGLSSLGDTFIDPLAGAADEVLKLDAALAAMAVTGLALAIKEAASFNDAFHEINTLAETSGEGMLQFRDDIIDYARDSKKSFEDIEGALYNAISLGIDYKDSLGVLDDAEKLAIATKSSLNDSLQTLGGTMNAYGAEADEASRYSDAFFTIIKDGKTTMPELATAISQVTNTAANAGIPFETLGAAIAAMTAAGAPTSQAITQIKAAIDNIIKPSRQASEIAAQLGIEFNATALETQGLDGMLRQVYEATGGNVEQMAKLFGSTEALGAALTLGADKSGVFAKALDDMANNTGATQKAFEEMEKNTGLALQNFYNNLKANLIELGLPLLETFGQDVSAASDLMKGLGTAIDSGAFDPLIEMLQKAGAELATWLSQVGEALPDALENVDFSPIIDSLKDLGGSFVNLFEVDLTDPEQLGKVIQGIVDTIGSLIKVTSGMVEAWKPFLDGILGAIEGFNDLDEESQKSYGNLLGLAKGIDALGQGIAVALLLIGDNADTMKMIFDVVINSIGMAWNTLRTGFDAILLAFVSLIENMLKVADAVNFGYMQEEIDKAKESVAGWRVAIEDDLIESGNKVLENSKNIAEAVGLIGEEAGDAAGDVSKLGAALDDVAGEKQLALAFDPSWESELDKATASLDKFAGDNEELDIAINMGGNLEEQILWTKDELEKLETLKTVEIVAAASDFEITVEEAQRLLGDLPYERVTEIIAYATQMGITLEDAKKQLDKMPAEKTTELKAKADEKSIEEAKKKIDELELKKIEIQAQIDIANIEAEAEKVKAAFEAMSHLGVAQIEADAAKYVAAIESIGTTVSSTSDLLGDLFGLWGDQQSLSDKWQVEEWIDEQLKIQREALDLQRSLVEEQIKYYQSRREALESGDAMIKIEAEGLEPELEAFMWKIIEKVQLRVTEEYSEYLLGLNPVAA